METIILPLPPPINRMYQFGKGNWYKTKEVREWETECGYKLLGCPRMAENLHYDIWVRLYLKRDRDIDGSIKVILDLLQTMQIIKNDSQVYHLDVMKQFDKENPRVEIKIHNY